MLMIMPISNKDKTNIMSNKIYKIILTKSIHKICNKHNKTMT